jgi:formate hydrogenlyase transcriptional activator
MVGGHFDAPIVGDGDRYRAWLAVAESIMSHRDLPALFCELASQLRHVVPFDYVVLGLYEPATNTLRLDVVEPADSALPSAGTVVPIEEWPAGFVFQAQRRLIISNVDEQTRWPRWLERVRPAGIQSICALPLTTTRCRLGTLLFACKEQACFDGGDLGFLQHAANQVAIAVENALAFQELTTLKNQLADRGQQYMALLGVSEAIVAHRDLPALFHELARQLQEVVQFDYLSLVMHDASNSTMRLHVLEAREPISPQPVLVLSLQDDPAGLVWQTQQPLVTSRVSELQRWPRLLERVQPYGVQSYCWLPLTTARRRLGTLVFTSTEPSTYDAVDLGFLQQVANQVAVAVDNALAFQELEAIRDQLAQDKAYLEEEVRTENFGRMVAVSTTLREVLKKVEIVAPTDSTVLVCGETGTGKELVARALHDLSPRSQRPLVKLNCAAIPTGLLESELFGHEKGAFTGAISPKIGRFELAHKGTLLLDEIGEIPWELQPKLLRVLQEQEFERLGGTKTIKVDVRLVAATNRDLAQMVAEGRFRSDLFYRVNVFPIMLPPLREQLDGIPSLVRHFTQQFARRMGRRIDTIPAATMEALVRYPWPGNVRELQNVIERAVILSPGRTLEVPLRDLEMRAETSETTSQRSVSEAGSLTSYARTPESGLTLADAEREHILRALRNSGWVVGGPKGAAARLGMKRSLLYWKMKKLGISRPM